MSSAAVLIGALRVNVVSYRTVKNLMAASRSHNIYRVMLQLPNARFSYDAHLKYIIVQTGYSLFGNITWPVNVGR